MMSSKILPQVEDFDYFKPICIKFVKLNDEFELDFENVMPIEALSDEDDDNEVADEDDEEYFNDNCLVYDSSEDLFSIVFEEIENFVDDDDENYEDEICNKCVKFNVNVMEFTYDE